MVGIRALERPLKGSCFNHLIHPSPHLNHSRMKYPLPKLSRRFLALGVGALLAPPLVAQNSELDESAFELSPFEVSATTDGNYRATDTLAGIRVRSDLREIASAITVVSDQMLRDIGATSSQTLLQYTTGTEVGGSLGNFSNLATVSPDDTSSRVRPQ